MSASAVSSSVAAPSGTAAAIPQVSGLAEQCYGKSTLKVADFAWNGTVSSEDSVCAANYNDITMYCCQQAGGASAFGVKSSAVVKAVNRAAAAKNADGTASPDCGLQLCKLPMDKEADFVYCQSQHGAEGSCQGAAAAASNSSTAAGDKDEKKDSAAFRAGPASIAVAATFLASAVLAL